MLRGGRTGLAVHNLPVGGPVFTDLIAQLKKTIKHRNLMAFMAMRKSFYMEAKSTNRKILLVSRKNYIIVAVYKPILQLALQMGGY